MKHIFLYFFVLVCLFSETAVEARHSLKTVRYLASAAPVAAPKPNEVCFAPVDPCDQKLLAFVKTARKSLDVAIYDINLDQLVHQLAVASKSIPVRVVVDQRQSKGSHSLVGLLVKAGVQVKYGHQRGIMHNKFTVLDNAMVEAGSFNYTHHASEANNENQVYLNTPEIVSRYKARFEQIWADGKPVQ